MTRPTLSGVLETVVYYAPGQEDEMHDFYTGVLGMRRLGPKSFAYRIGPHIFLMFDRERAAVQNEPPPHGASGSVHTCFTCSPEDYEGWKAFLTERGIETMQEITWRNGVRSFYLRDPAGNLLEIAEGDLWPE